MPRKSQKSSSQNKSTNANASGRLTQSTLNFMEDEDVDIEEHANNCVRYLIQKSAIMMPFKKSEMYKNVFVKLSGRQYETILEQVTKILREVYAYHLILIDGSVSNKIYILTSALPHIEEEPEESPTDARRVLLLLILTHIFMSSNSTSDTILKKFLKTFKIDLDSKHTSFGNLKDYMNTLIKQKYIDAETDPISKQITYVWGMRADNEISKMAILEFVCKVYGDRIPTSWAQHYEDARKQDGEYILQPQNSAQEDNTAMEVEEDDDDDDDDLT